MRVPRSTTIVLAGLALQVAVQRVRADAPGDEARSLLARGNRELAEGRCGDALASYAQVKRLVPTSYKIEVNLAAAHECLGRRARAAAHLEAFIERSDADADRTMRDQVEKKLRALGQGLAVVTVACAMDGAEVMVDEERVGTTPVGRFYLEPGRRRLQVRKAGHPLFVLEVQARPGERLGVHVPWDMRPAASGKRRELSATGPRPDRVVVQPASAEGAAAPRVSKGAFWTRWWFWAAVGVVAGATAGAVVAARSGGSDRLPRGELTTVGQE